MKRITSRHHPLVTTCRALARGRDASGDDRLLLDGPHLAAEALRTRLRIDTVAVTEAWLAGPEGQRLDAALRELDADLVSVSDSVMEAVSPVSTPAGIVMIAHRPSLGLDRVLDGPAPLVVIACDVQDPGNVGAILRASEAGGATGAIFCGASADPFGWKALRGSMGSALRLPVVARQSVTESLAAAHRAGIQVLATVPREGVSLDEVAMTGPIAVLLGGEGPGLPEDIIASSSARVTIPMRAPVESLNVAVAAALLVYEAARQRRAAARPGSPRGASQVGA